MGIFNYEVKDINLAKTGLEKIEWAYRNMPVLRAIEAELIEKQPSLFPYMLKQRRLVLQEHWPGAAQRSL